MSNLPLGRKDDSGQSLATTPAIEKTKNGYRLISPAAVALEYSASKKKWQAQRKTFIGGSDASAIANTMPNSKEKYGISLWNKYSSPLTVYMEKVEGVEKPYTAAMARGHRREAAIRAISAKEIMKEEGLKKGVKVYASKYTYNNNVHPFMGANLDGLVDHPFYGICGLEIKTANEWAGRDWDNGGVPASYYCQVQHYIYVTGLNRFYLVAEVGDYIYVRVIERNDGFIADLFAAESAFYNQMQDGIRPQPIGIENENQFIKTPQKNNDYVEADDLSGVLSELETLKAQQKEIEQAIMQHEQLIKQAIGEKEGVLIEGRKITWKEQTSHRFDSTRFKAEEPDIYAAFMKESVSRVLRIGKGGIVWQV